MDKVLINGEPVASVSFADRGLYYGDGVFETIAIMNGQAQYWQRHEQRLVKGCRRLQIPVPDIDQLLHELNHLTSEQKKAVVKIIITRGEGGRGYKTPVNPSPTRIVALYDYPDYPREYWEQGVKTRLCNTVLGLNPDLAGIKHCNRLEQILARNEWQDAEIAEGLMLDVRHNVIEGTMTNIFIVKNKELKTPLLDHCGVEGVMRDVVMESVRDQKMRLSVDIISVAEVLDADEIFLTNSVIGIWPVREFEGQTFMKGPVTQQLMERLSIRS